MANGANRLFDVIKQTGESTNGISSQVVSLTIKSVNPLILMRDDRLEIPAEFCILHKSLDINNFRINDIVTAIVLNNGQQYFILYNDTAEEQRINYNDLDNKPKINNVELIGNKTSNDLGLNNYFDLDNKPKINGVELSGNKTSDDLLIVSKSELQQIVAEMVNNINNKVNKSGDTMTGALLMQGNPIRFGTTGNIFWKEDGFGDKFRILPYFSGSGSDNKLVLQSTTGGAGEDPQNWKDLVKIHADTGEIDLIGRTALQVTSYLTDGAVRAFKIGNIVIVEINGSMQGKIPNAWTDYPIAKLNIQAGERATTTIVDQVTGLCADAWIDWGSDTIYINKRAVSSINGEWLRGQLIFIVN